MDASGPTSAGVIVTVTPNPSLDRTLAVPALDRGTVIRASVPATIDPSGKGINVSRALATAGRTTRAVLPVGGPDGAALVAQLRFDHVAVPIAAAIRSNVSVVEPDGTVTKLNEPGPTLSTAEWTALLDTAARAGARAAWVAGCGSLPAGVPDDFYARLAAAVAAPVALDSSGAALRAGLAGRPHVVKPNLAELIELTDRTVSTVGEAVAAAEAVRAAGAQAVLASLGADGAILLDRHGLRYGRAAVPVLRSAVGAGDALLAGFLAGGTGPDGLVEGLAWAAAACGLPGTAVPAAADIDRDLVTVTEHPDPDQPLTESP